MADTPATVLSDGDAGLWRLQRESLPDATVVLDWWQVRFEHALQASTALARLIRTCLARRFADLNRRSGACGTSVGRMPAYAKLGFRRQASGM
jgi:hypothetical protein